MHAKSKPEEKPRRPAGGVAAAQSAGGEGRTSAFKAKRDAKLKERAADPTRWNSLYMRSDTVVSAVAQQMGVAKSAGESLLCFYVPFFHCMRILLTI